MAVLDVQTDPQYQNVLLPGRETQAPPQPPPSFGGDPRGSGPAGGGGINWNQLMQSMPDWLKGSASANAMRDQAAATRRAAIQQLAIKYGGLPASFQDKYGDFDEATKALAQQNQFSDLNLLAKSYADSQVQLKKQLAARRALGSGETQYGLDKIDTQRGISEYNLGNDFLGGVNQAYAGYGDRLQQAYAIEEQAAQAARMQALQLMMLQSQGGGGGVGGVGSNYGLAPGTYGSDFPITETGVENLLIKEPYDYVKNSDIRYLTPNYGGPSGGWTPDGDGWIGPDGRRYDQEGRVR